MDGQETKKASAFLLATNELMAQNFQRDMDRLRKELCKAKFDNHVLKIKCGDIAESLAIDEALIHKDGEVSTFKTNIMSWGEVGAFLTERQIGFYKRIFLFAIQSEIGRERVGEEGLFDIMPPMSAFKMMVNEFLSRQVCIAQEVLSNFQDFICTILHLREYDTRHDDIRVLIELFKQVILQTCNNCPAASGFLEVLIGHSVSGFFTTYVVCQMGSEVSENLAGQSLGRAPVTESTHAFLHCLICICQACLSNLSEWCRQTEPNDMMIEDIANSISKISGNCDILSAMYPETSLEGKRCCCILVACLQAMQQC